jgi:hypothetical protein
MYTVYEKAKQQTLFIQRLVEIQLKISKNEMLFITNFRQAQVYIPISKNNTENFNLNSNKIIPYQVII